MRPQTTSMNNYIDIAPEVKVALEQQKGVVALESTIIAHGMPYPQNVTTAREVEDIIRAQGAVPATIAILNGRIKIGLSPEELEHLGKSEEVAKVSRRDLPYIVAQKLDGATTVAGTMIIAAMAGIEVFVTGGIGGVHRGASESFDISADLMELANTSVAVVCAGAKSILDIGLTLEYLETHGVPVIGYGTQEFPAFYTRKSGFGVDFTFDSPMPLAKMLRAKWDLGLQGGVVIGNPIPEQYAMDGEAIEQVIVTALQAATAQRVKGKAITPFILAYVKKATSGKSLESNIMLVKNNALVGAQLAKALVV